MSFDIDRVLSDMAGTIAGTVKDGSSDIKGAVLEILNAEREVLKDLADALLRNEIDDAIFKREIEREKKVIEAELLTVKIMTKALLQRAVNAAIEVFVNSVKLAM